MSLLFHMLMGPDRCWHLVPFIDQLSFSLVPPPTPFNTSDKDSTSASDLREPPEHRSQAWAIIGCSAMNSWPNQSGVFLKSYRGRCTKHRGPARILLDPFPCLETSYIFLSSPNSEKMTILLEKNLELGLATHQNKKKI